MLASRPPHAIKDSCGSSQFSLLLVQRKTFHVPVTFTSVVSKAALIFWEQMSTMEDFSDDPEAIERVQSSARGLLQFRGAALVAIVNAFDFASVAARVKSVMINTTRTRQEETKVMELDVA